MGIVLKSIEYSERVGRELEWTVESILVGQVNLLVGKNSAGKTRVLNTIANLSSDLLSPTDITRTDATYKLHFEGDGTSYDYDLDIQKNSVQYERLTVNGDVKLDRDSNGLKIYAEKEEKAISYLPSSREISAGARRDKLQHTFLLPIREWAIGLRHYHFGADLGKLSFMVNTSASNVNLVRGIHTEADRDEDKAVQICAKGMREFPGSFEAAVIGDMKAIGYDIVSLGVVPASGITFNPPIPITGPIEAIAIEEPGVSGRLQQHLMSHGMFRALSLFIQVNYSQLAGRANCILVDDIGEGLDFERSTKLIEVLRNKAYDSAFQLIMTTNDQFVMNHVPLDEWSLLQRKGCHVKVLNKQNSADKFEEFKFVGLSNFSFFEMDYANSAAEEAIANE